MVNTIVSIPGYVHLYRSLLRFYDMPENEVREMLYLLNTANLDCYEYYHPERDVIQSGPVAFSGWLEKMDCRPYRTEVQLYKSLLFLQRSVDPVSYTHLDVYKRQGLYRQDPCKFPCGRKSLCLAEGLCRHG